MGLKGNAVHPMLFYREGPPVPEETLECIAKMALPNVSGSWEDSWDEAMKEQRDQAVRRRRRCNCPRCKKWRANR